MSEHYDGRQYVGLDFAPQADGDGADGRDRRASGNGPFANDAEILAHRVGKAGPAAEVVVEATYGWYWAVEALQAAGATVHLAHPLGVKRFAYRRERNDVRDATDLAHLLRMHRLPEAWIAPAAVRAQRELVRHRHQAGAGRELGKGTVGLPERQPSQRRVQTAKER